MKRYLCLALSLLVCISLLPFYAYASPESPESVQYDLTPEEVRAIINEAFPEYVALNQGGLVSENSIQNRSATEATLLREQTRAVSDNMSVTYLEYSNGRSFGVLHYSVTNVNSSTNSYASSHTVDVYITCYGSSGQVKIDNFQYVLVNNAYDSISSRGTLDNSLADQPGLEGAYQMTETASSNAYAKYTCYFITEPIVSSEGEFYRCVTGSVTLTVGDDLFRVSMSEIYS